MPQSEVEALLGGPPGNYGRGGGGMMTMEGYIAPPGSVERIWCDDRTRFELYFDARGSLVGSRRRKGYSQRVSDGLLERLWRSIRRFVGR